MGIEVRDPVTGEGFVSTRNSRGQVVTLYGKPWLSQPCVVPRHRRLWAWIRRRETAHGMTPADALRMVNARHRIFSDAVVDVYLSDDSAPE